MPPSDLTPIRPTPALERYWLERYRADVALSLAATAVQREASRDAKDRLHDVDKALLMCGAGEW